MHRKQTGSFKGDVDEYVPASCANAAGKLSIIVTRTGVRFQIANRRWRWRMVARTRTSPNAGAPTERIAHLAHYDALTDLPNRTLFREKLEQEIKRIHAAEQLAVLYIDIDEFKSVNDSLGHPIGDELLKAVATRLGRCVKETDVVARLGGDEFRHRPRPGSSTDRRHRPCGANLPGDPGTHECLGHQVAADASTASRWRPRTAPISTSC